MADITAPYTLYTLDDTAASTAVVDTGSGLNDGVASANASTLTAAGKKGTCFEFDGLTEYVTLAALMADIKTDTTGTIACWIYPTGSGGDTLFGASCSGAGATWMQIYVDLATGQLVVNVEDDPNFNPSSVWVASSDASTISTNTWSHIAIVQNGTSPQLYINGQAVTTTFAHQADKTYWFADLNAASPMDYMHLAAYYNAGVAASWAGKIDDFRYYQNTALSAGEVLALYNSYSTKKQIIYY